MQNASPRIFVFHSKVTGLTKHQHGENIKYSRSKYFSLNIKQIEMSFMFEIFYFTSL